MLTPSAIYRSSDRRPVIERSPEYPKHFEVRAVSRKGMISWNRQTVFVSEALANEPVGIEEIEEGVHRVSFGSLPLGLLADDYPDLGLIHPNSKRLERVLPMCPVQV